MLCDLRVLKRFTPATQGEKTHFPKKNQGFCGSPKSGNFLLYVSAPHESARNTKHQTPSSREVPNLKTPNPKNRCRGKRRASWLLSLEPGASLEFGVWSFSPGLSASQKLRDAPRLHRAKA